MRRRKDRVWGILWRKASRGRRRSRQGQMERVPSCCPCWLFAVGTRPHRHHAVFHQTLLHNLSGHRIPMALHHFDSPRGNGRRSKCDGYQRPGSNPCSPCGNWGCRMGMVWTGVPVLFKAPVPFHLRARSSKGSWDLNLDPLVHKEAAPSPPILVKVKMRANRAGALDTLASGQITWECAGLTLGRVIHSLSFSEKLMRSL